MSKLSREPGLEASEKERDRISQLPDELIHHIFSHLDSRQAVQTCILSKRFINLWSTLTCLKLVVPLSTHDHYHNFVNNFFDNRDQQSVVSRVTVQVDTFRFISRNPILHVETRRDSMSVRKILAYAVSHNVKYLDIRGGTLADDCPCVTSAYIKTLCLGFTDFDPTGWTLPSLTSLHMEYVGFYKPITILGFEKLKELTLYYINENFTINCSNLESLTTLFSGGKFLVSAPNLSYLKIRSRTDHYVPDFSSADILPCIKKVDIDIVIDYSNGAWNFDNNSLKHYMGNLINILRAVGGTPVLKLSREAIQVLRLILDISEYQPCPLWNLGFLYLQGQGLCEKPSKSTDRVIKYLLTNSPSAKIVMGK